MTARSGITHQPGLDGIRGLAVAAVVAFHTGAGVVPGGFLGVSLFFTLSGVVIGTIILHELRATRGFSPREFWGRRARRLLPVAWVVLAVVAVGRLLSARLSATTTADVAASWLHVANWQFLAREQSYQDLFTGPSALLHYWSLAIEEQFYLVVGLAAMGVAAVSRRPARLFGVTAAIGALVSFALPVVLQPSVDRVYYGTDTRAGELLIGLVIAAWLSSAAHRTRLLAHARLAAVVGLVALAATVTAWIVFEPADRALRLGLLPATTLASSGLIVGALVPRGVVWRLTSTRLLRRLGHISYGLYVVHWPVFVVLETISPSPWLRILVGTPVAVALAVLSAWLVELPVRRRTLAVAPTMAAATAVAVLIVTTLVIPARRSTVDEFLDDLATAAPATAPPTTRPPPTSAEATVETSPPTATAEEPAGGQGGGLAPLPDADSPEATTTTSAATTTTAAPAPPAVAFFGDSIALSLALAAHHAPAVADYRLTDGAADIGCGAVLSPFPQPEATCPTAPSRWAAAVTDRAIDIPVVMSCQWELVAQRLPGEDVERVIGDPVFDAYLLAGLGQVVDGLRAAGAERVLWVRCPRLSLVNGTSFLDGALLSSRDPARVDRWNQLLAELDLARADVGVLDLATWVDARVDDATVRPDGEHYAYVENTGVAAELSRLVADAV